MISKKRKDSFFGIHFDFHAMEGQVVPSVWRPDAYEEMLDAVKPDYVQCDTKGHAGYSSYPTNVGVRAAMRSGIDILKVEDTFGSLGGSWKMEGATLTATYGRRLHGRHGRGRFKAFALGTHVEWRTTMRAGEGLISYVLSGDAAEPGLFHIAQSETPGPATGTEVFVTGIRATADSLTVAEMVVQALAAKFALYLKSYPDVRIYFNGLPVTPVIVQKRTTDYKLSLENGSTAKLEVIEWKRKFTGAGRLVFAGTDGFQRRCRTSSPQSSARAGSPSPRISYPTASPP